MKKQITTDRAPAAIGPYSQAIELNGMIFASGQLPIDPVTGDMPDDAAAQAEQSLANVEAILTEAGSSMDSIVKTTVLLSDIVDFAAVNAVYEKHFSQPFPARSCFAVAALPKGAKVEIEVIAAM